jgi:hypothetical protein
VEAKETRTHKNYDAKTDQIKKDVMSKETRHHKSDDAKIDQVNNDVV